MRTAIAGLFGVANEDARTGQWWEVDAIFVVLLAAFILGIGAWLDL